MLKRIQKLEGGQVPGEKSGGKKIRVTRKEFERLKE